MFHLGGSRTHLGDSSPRFHASTFESAVVFALGVQGGRGICRRRPAPAPRRPPAQGILLFRPILSAVLPSDQPPHLKPAKIVATAPSGCALQQTLQRFSLKD